MLNPLIQASGLFIDQLLNSKALREKAWFYSLKQSLSCMPRTDKTLCTYGSKYCLHSFSLITKAMFPIKSFMIFYLGKCCTRDLIELNAVFILLALVTGRLFKVSLGSSTHSSEISPAFLVVNNSFDAWVSTYFKKGFFALFMLVTIIHWLGM